MEHHLELPAEPDATAPDGSSVRVLLASPKGGMAQFEFPPSNTTPAVRHKTVDELWYFVTGRGQMWLSNGGDEGFGVGPGVCVSIPVGVSFQVRSEGEAPLVVVGVTMPPWPGEGEVEIVEGPWEPTLEPGPH